MSSWNDLGANPHQEYDPDLMSATRAAPSKASSNHYGESSTVNSVRKKRGPHSVTSNACTHCKRAKAKCDGGKPSCKRCVDRGQEEDCHYELHTKTQKEAMIKEIKDLREKNSWVDLILKAIRTSEGGEIIERLRNGESYETISQSLRTNPFPGFPSLSPNSQLQLTRAIAEYGMDMEGERTAGNLIPGHGWTSVTHNQDLIDHLLALYFTWVHPVHMLFSETHFMASFKNRSDLYCTKALVNTILAMGCHLFQVGDDQSVWQGVDPNVLREKFMEEARSLIPQDERPKMTTIQSFAIMFLVDLATGKGSRASHYLRLAADALNTRLEFHYSTEAMEVTRWGIYSLNVAWGGLTYQNPNIIPAMMRNAEVFDFVTLNNHDGLWRFYRHAGDYDSISEHPSSAVLVARESAKLMRQVHKSIDLLYDGRDHAISARGLLQRYRAYLDWERDLPDMISLPLGIARADEIEQLVPHVLSLHIQYHIAQIHLFQPFLELPSFTGPTRQHIMSIAVDHARQAYEALQLYQELYSSRYQPSLQTFCLLHTCDTLIRYSPNIPLASEVVRFCLTNLEETSDGRGGFAVCGPLQEMFRRTAVSLGIPIPDDLSDGFGRDNRGRSPEYSSDDFLDACTRLSYRQPIDQIIIRMDPTISEDFAREWKDVVDRSNSSTESSDRSQNMRISDLLNG